MKLLLAKGLYVNSINERNETPLHLASYNNHLEVVITLVQNKAEINTQTKYVHDYFSDLPHFIMYVSLVSNQY